MTTYERVVNGQVVERVQPVSGDLEDTRLGMAVLEGHPEWRVARPATGAESEDRAEDGPVDEDQAAEAEDIEE